MQTLNGLLAFLLFYRYGYQCHGLMPIHIHNLNIHIIIRRGKRFGQCPTNFCPFRIDIAICAVISDLCFYFLIKGQSYRCLFSCLKVTLILTERCLQSAPGCHKSMDSFHWRSLFHHLCRDGQQSQRQFAVISGLNAKPIGSWRSRETYLGSFQHHVTAGNHHLY